MKHLLNINTQTSDKCYKKRNPYITGNNYVDLGLSNGLKWASCNLGAENPYEYGDFYQWGDVDGYSGYDGLKLFDWEDYKYCQGSEITLAKYCLDASDGTVDGKSQLDGEDDAAIQNLRSQTGHENARMPKTGEYQILKNETIWVWSPGGKVGVKKTDESGGETIDYVDYPTGYFVFKVKSQSDKGAKGTFTKDKNNGNLNGFSKTEGVVYYPGAHSVTEGDVTTIEDGDTHIFLPASGYCVGSSLYGRGSVGYYWSSSLLTSNPYRGPLLGFNSGCIGPQYSSRYRYYGFCVRAVSEN